MITITAASGQFGRHALDELLRRGVPAGQIVATARDTSELADYAKQGVQVRRADYDDGASLDQAFRDLGRLLSHLLQRPRSSRRAARQRDRGDEAGRGIRDRLHQLPQRRHQRHRHGRGPRQDRADDPRQRHPVRDLAQRLLHRELHRPGGVLAAIRRRGRRPFSGASRKDLAIAAAAIISGDPVTGQTYELGAHPDYTMQDLVNLAAELSGKPITYTNLPQDDYAGVLVSGGFPKELADALADNNAGALRGAWHTASDDLTRILGRPATGPRQVMADALAALGQH